MQYYLVESNKIIDGPRELPRSWRNVSGLDKATPTELLALGWCPSEVVGFEPFDEATQVRTGPVIEIMATKVIQRWTVRDLSTTELEERDDAKKEIALTPVTRPALLGALLDHENRLRALESKSPVTGAQLLDIIKRVL